MCFFFGGLKYKEQNFNTTVASTMSSLMAVATSSLIIPAALYSTLVEPKEKQFKLILDLSRGTSVVLLILYVLYLGFQLGTHAFLFDAEHKPGRSDNDGAQHESAESDDSDSMDEHQEALLSGVESGIVLVVVTVLVAICAEYLVGSIDEIVASSGISKTFIGLILIPIVGNAAEHVTAVVVAMKNKVRATFSLLPHSNDKNFRICSFLYPICNFPSLLLQEPSSFYPSTQSCTPRACAPPFFLRFSRRGLLPSGGVIPAPRDAPRPCQIKHEQYC